MKRRLKIKFCGDYIPVHILPCLAFGSNLDKWSMYIGWFNVVWNIYLEEIES